MDLYLEEVDPVAPQVNRVQEERSSSLDVGELNENIGKLTKLLANMNMAGPGRRMGPLKCFFPVVKLIMVSLHIDRCTFLGIDISLPLELTVWCSRLWPLVFCDALL